jgi:cyclic pyranopterin phosphate synthase
MDKTYLRLSVTDKCMLRCLYCRPDGGVQNVPHPEVLRFEETAWIVRFLTRIGVCKVRFTGGEPLIKQGVADLIRLITAIPEIREFALTTNALRLAGMAAELKRAGIQRVNISLDSLDPATYRQLTGQDRLADVLAGISVAKQVGLLPIKINMVLLRDINDREILDFCRLAIREGISLRFIELMPTGINEAFYHKHFLPVKSIWPDITREFELLPRQKKAHDGPAQNFLVNGTSSYIGFISSESHPFCASCNRLRLTSVGKLAFCLYSPRGFDFKAHLRPHGQVDLPGLAKLDSAAILSDLNTFLAEASSNHPQVSENPLQGFCMSQIGG